MATVVLERAPSRIGLFPVSSKAVGKALRLAAFVPPRGDAVRNLVPRCLGRARKLTPHLPPSSSAV
jgi:hypothetical protein